MLLARVHVVCFLGLVTCRSSAPPGPPPPPWGGLVVHERGAPIAGGGSVVVLLHGYGAPGTDLVGLEHEIGDVAGVSFVFPEAPIDLGSGRAWWPLGDARERRIAGEDLSSLEPAGLEGARRRVQGVLDELASRGIARRRIVLGGFSQGAMLALDVALEGDSDLAGVALLSGTIVAEPRWRVRAGVRSGRVLVTHGRQDPLLPFDVAERIPQLLAPPRWSTRMVVFDGGHAIPPEVRATLGEFIRASLR